MALLETQVANYFVVVARHQSFTRAAVELATSQSNVTAKIRRLEALFGHALFHRHSRGVSLTEQGAQLLSYCQNLVHAAEVAQRCVLSGNAASARLRIGMLYTTTYLMPKIIADFVEANKGVLLTVRTGSTEEMRTLLGNGDIDCALISGVGVDGGMIVHLRMKEKLGWLVKAGKLDRQSAILPQLTGMPIFSVKRGNLYEASVRQLFQDGGETADMPLFLELGSREVLRAVLLTGQGYAFVPHGLFAQEIEQGLFDFHAIEAPLPRLFPALVTRRDADRNEVLMDFIQHCLRVAPS